MPNEQSPEPIGNESPRNYGQLYDTSNDDRLPRLQLWERKLLDFSLRNNLLNLRLRGKVVQIGPVDIAALEDLLQDGKDMEIIAKEKQEKEAEPVTDESLKKGRIRSVLDDDDLALALKGLHRAARTSMEENGANTLYIVLGLLKWYEEGNKDPEKVRLAPILLLPVELVRKSGGHYVIRRRDEDMMLNTTLVELMRQQYDVDMSVLNNLPTDEHGIDVHLVMETVRQLFADKANWSVAEDAVLGLFSFSKFVMWNDIHTNGEKMRENSIVESLIQNRLVLDPTTAAAEDQPAIDARTIDQTTEPKGFAVPLDVDSSQLEAVIESGEGKSFILHGPPGTGKSQTITNMIANALYHGKRVLFVAEKMAALSVVQKRLDKIGLGPFCLEMHSNKATKNHFLAQMEAALNVTHYHDTGEFERQSALLYEQRQRLIAYMQSLHRKREAGFSLYECITEGLAIAEQPLDLHGATYAPYMTKDGLAAAVESLADTDGIFRSTGHPGDHPLRELTILDTSVGYGDTLRNELSNVQAWVNVLMDSGAQMQTLTVAQLQEMARLKRVLNEKEALATQAYDRSILDEDPNTLLRDYNDAESKWFIPKYFAKSALKKRLRAFRPDVDWQDIPKQAERMKEYRSARQELDESMPVTLKNAAFDALEQLDNWLNRYEADCEQLNLPQLTGRMANWATHIDKVHAWSLWCNRKKELQLTGLTVAIDHLTSQHKSGAETANALKKAVYRQQAVQAIDADPSLQMFNGLQFEQMIEKYRDMAKQFQTLTKEELYLKLAARIPNLTIEASNSSEVGILKRSIRSKGRGVTIRQLFDLIPTLLPKLCPCMLMSPISVAQYIDMNSEKFDLVIFDEASQMPTSEAVGAIARGKALVVVGDPMQMPPTNFFSTSNVSEEEVEYDDMESILDDCITLSVPSRYLTWHYRSKHESLIAFSNSQYYEGKLYTFPSVDDRLSKVQYVAVDGVYDYGKTRSNRAEAEAIVAEVIRRLSDKELSKRSIGVVSFSKVQQDLIEDLLVSELAKHPELEAKAYEGEEPVFVKNLENVQGDERDVILFSVGYGPDKDGKVSMNFGPLNNTGGERRLNVAVSRARYEMMIFSTLRPEQIDLKRTNAEGVKGLKMFLEFAQHGRIMSGGTVANAQLLTPEEARREQALVDAIAAELQARGHQVDKRVGRSNFKVDLAIVDPNDSGTYALGILCDGKTYFDTKTQRDREIVQPSVLGMLNWKTMRVWSVDWFLNKDDVIARIEKMLKPSPTSPTGEGSHQAPRLSTLSLEKGTEPSTPHPTANVQKSTPASSQPTTNILNSKNVAHDDVQQTYATAQVAQPPMGTLINSAAGERLLDKQIPQIIKAEQPITFKLLYKRIAERWAVPRMDNAFISLVSRHLGTAYCDPMMKNDQPYYWRSFEDSLNYNHYRINSGRDIDEIPVIEVMNAMRYSVEQQIAIPVDDLKKHVAVLLGFSRSGSRIEAYISKALDILLKSSQLTIDNGMVKTQAS